MRSNAGGDVSIALERRFEATSDAPARARAFLIGALIDVDPDARATAALLASELVTNAVSHAHSPLTLHVETSDDLLHIEVADDEPRFPGLVGVPGRHGGYGLRIVEALANDWGVVARPHGKSVWFDIDLVHPRGL
jgi:two-component sensor histidine kinase